MRKAACGASLVARAGEKQFHPPARTLILVLCFPPTPITKPGRAPALQMQAPEAAQRAGAA